MIGRVNLEQPPTIILVASSGKLRSPCTDVPDLAALFLGKMKSDAASAVPALCEATKHKLPHVRAQALFALGEIDPNAKRPVPVLCEALRNPEIDSSGNKTVLVFQESDTQHTNSERSVRFYAAVALGQFGSDAAEVVPLLLPIKRQSWRGSPDWLAAEEAVRKISH